MPLFLDRRLNLHREQTKHPFSNLPSLFLDIRSVIVRTIIRNPWCHYVLPHSLSWNPCLDSSDGIDLLMRLLAYDPEKRLTGALPCPALHYNSKIYAKRRILMHTHNFHDHHQFFSFSSSEASEGLAHGYLHQSPFPRQEGLMPTFRTLHGDGGAGSVAGQVQGRGLKLGYDAGRGGGSGSDHSYYHQRKRPKH